MKQPKARLGGRLALPPGFDAYQTVAPTLMRTTIVETGFVQTIAAAPRSPPGPYEVSLQPPRGLTAAGPQLEVLGVLGRGGMGSVLLAKERVIGREVAVKVALSEASADSLLTEAWVTAAVEHPGVIPLYGLGSDQRGLPALIMRRVQGVSWRVLLDDPEHQFWKKLEVGGEVRLETNLRVLVQICNTLASAHARGIIHRDLKPENIMLGEFGEIYVADWGLAMHLTAPSESCLVGTPAYLAPEMVLGGALSVRTDVFLAGATLYEILAGRPPWFGATIDDVLNRAARGVPEPLPPEVEPTLAAICQRATEALPEARYQSVLELRDALTQYLRHRSSVALCEAANGCLVTLRQAVRARAEAGLLYRHLSECRFGFTQALRAWPENPAATSGLHEALSLGVEFELDRGHPDAAQALMLEMTVAPPSLRARVEQLSFKARTSSDQLKALVENTDNTKGVRRRRVFAGVLIALTLGFMVSGVLLPDFWRHPAALLISSVVFGAFLFSTLWAIRLSSARSTWVNRSILRGVAFLSVGTVALRALAYRFALPEHLTLSLEACLLGAGTAVLAVSVHRALFAPAALSVATIGLIMFAPSHAHQIYSASLVTGMATVVIWLRYGKTTVVQTGG